MIKKVVPFLSLIGGKEASFSERYSEVESILFNGKQVGETGKGKQQSYEFNSSNLPLNISCSNPRCRQGGFSIKHLIDFIIAEKMTEYETTVYCIGHEGAGRGRRKGDPCLNRIKATIQIKYRQ